MRTGTWLISLLILLFATATFAAEKIVLLEIDGAIGPATQDYIKRGIDQAAQEKARAVIIQLNTPGGLESAMRGISEAILSAPVPVITYVAPAGARAASAGTFIVYASHVAAMAPGTNIGAASPVPIASPHEKTDTKALSDVSKKATNDAAAYIRSVAQLRGRNAEWAERAVRHAASLSAEEAKRLKVIDEMAESYPALLQKIDGRTVSVAGAPQQLNTKNVTLEKNPPGWRYDFLSFITNPNIAYILMLIAIYGLFFELANPGLILPGVAGMIALLLVLYAFQLMPINYTGLALVVVGILFMLAEVYVSSFGALGIGGVLAFMIGSIMLFDIGDPHYRLALTLIISMSVLSLAFFLVVVRLAIQSHQKAIVTGREGLLGQEGIVSSVAHGHLLVHVLGEQWTARSSIVLHPGQKVVITKVEGLTLFVEPVKEK